MDKYYAGIGSRETPLELIPLIEKIAGKLEYQNGYTLRSGGAIGADTMFENAVLKKDIYLPWND